MVRVWWIETTTRWVVWVEIRRSLVRVLLLLLLLLRAVSSQVEPR